MLRSVTFSGSVMTFTILPVLSDVLESGPDGLEISSGRASFLMMNEQQVTYLQWAYSEQDGWLRT